MSKVILIPVHPDTCSNILNEIATILIRKFKVEVGTKVYVYCTVGNYDLFEDIATHKFILQKNSSGYSCAINNTNLNGKVVASFVVSKCDVIKHTNLPSTINNNNVLKKACISDESYLKYAKSKSLYALHISQLKIFDRPKELKEFEKWVDCAKLSSKAPKCLACPYSYMEDDGLVACARPVIKKAPQSFVYVEELK